MMLLLFFRNLVTTDAGPLMYDYYKVIELVKYISYSKEVDPIPHTTSLQQTTLVTSYQRHETYIYI